MCVGDPTQIQAIGDQQMYNLDPHPDTATKPMAQTVRLPNMGREIYAGFDNVIMRIVALQLAFPVMLLSLVLVALLGTNLFNLVIVFVFTGWPIFARTIRASTLALRQRGFVESARGLGAGRFRIMFRYILPNALGPLIVVATFEVAKVLIFESSLSFLSLGIQPPTPTWGNMMSEGRSILAVAWWVTFFPGIMLVLAAASSNIAGDGINAMVDPQVRRAR